jgi:hypothetical protein
MQSGFTEAQSLLGQKAPAARSLHEAVLEEGIRWVTVSGGDWHCDDAVTIHRRGALERWLRGPVAVVEIPITADGDDELLVARFEKAVSCAERAGRPLTGVIGSHEIFTSRDAARRWRQPGRRVAVLNVDASPTQALVMLLGLGALVLAAALFSGYYLKLMLRPGDRDPAYPPMSRRIEPR